MCSIGGFFLFPGYVDAIQNGNLRRNNSKVLDIFLLNGPFNWIGICSYFEKNLMGNSISFLGTKRNLAIWRNNDWPDICDDIKSPLMIPFNDFVRTNGRITRIHLFRANRNVSTSYGITFHASSWIVHNLPASFGIALNPSAKQLHDFTITFKSMVLLGKGIVSAAFAWRESWQTLEM